MTLGGTQEPAAWDLRCMLCGRLAGQLVDAAFVHDPNCPLVPDGDAGRRRCCGCGGSLLKEQASWPLARVVQPTPIPTAVRRRGAR